MNQDIEDLEFELWTNRNELFHSAPKAIRWAKIELSRMAENYNLSKQWTIEFERDGEKVFCKIGQRCWSLVHVGEPRANDAEAIIEAVLEIMLGEQFIENNK
jgi:hypothetical protein